MKGIGRASSSNYSLNDILHPIQLHDLHYVTLYRYYYTLIMSLTYFSTVYYVPYSVSDTLRVRTLLETVPWEPPHTSIVTDIINYKVYDITRVRDCILAGTRDETPPL